MTTKASERRSSATRLARRDEVARALGVAPPAARDAAVSSDHRRLREARPASRGSRRARWSTAKCTCCRWRCCAIAASLDRTIRHELVHLMTDAALGAAAGVGARRRGDLLRRRAPPMPGEIAAAPRVQARAARVVSRRQRAAAPGVGRRAQQRLRARPRVLRETDRTPAGTWTRRALIVVYFGSGTVGTV